MSMKRASPLIQRPARWLAVAAPLLAALCLPHAATAQTETFHQKHNLTVKRVFAEGPSGGGFFPTEDIAADCLWGLIYFDLAQPAGRAQMALLINAKAQNFRLQRVDYKKNAAGYPAGTCVLTGLHVE
jgi:hypothetical protein